MNPGEKRGLNKDYTYQNEGKKSRQFKCEVLEALQKDLLQGLVTNIETLIRPVIAEELDRSLAKVFHQGRAPHRQITASPARKLLLQFSTSPKAESFTETKLESIHGDTIRVMLMDANTGQPVTTGPESVIKLEVVPLVGDVNDLDEQEWTAEEFERHVAHEREGRGQLLVGELKFYLKGGVGTLGQMSFTDNSSCTRSKKFRLGVKVAHDNDDGLACIREGISQAFTVKDIRGIAYMKHDIPSPTADVWRLRNIRRHGPYHMKLMQHRIFTVKDFLACKQARPELLKEVLGRMSAKQYQDTINHAEKCVLGDKMYIYPVNQDPYENLLFNQNYQTVGAVAQGHFVGLDMLNDVEKVKMDSLVKDAYDHWGTNVTEYKIEDLTTVENSFIMPALPESVDGLPSDVTHGVEHTIEGSNDYLDGSAMVEWTSQGQGSGSDEGCLSQKMSFLPPFYPEHFGFTTTADEEAINPQNIQSLVKDVIREDEEDGAPFQLFSFDDSSPTVNRWWLRIRTVVRCALFIRKAGSDRQQQLEN